MVSPLVLVFFFNDTATTEIYTLSLHDALPISLAPQVHAAGPQDRCGASGGHLDHPRNRLRGSRHEDRKSTRLNSSHEWISYAVFCLKKKKKGLEDQIPHDDPRQVNASHDTILA